MKKLVIVLNLVCMFALGSFAQSMYGDAAKADVKMKYVYSFEEALKRAKEEHKLIFFNCFADWAIPCHSMNKLVFSDQEFADWMDKHFVNFFIDVTSREGRPLAEKYRIRFQAHYLVLDENGQIVHRIVGGYQIPEFKAILEKALNPKTSFAGMNKRYEAGERSVKFLSDYADILSVADQDGEVYAKIIEELFNKLKKKEWSKKEYWKFFTRQLKSVNDEMFKYMVENKADFVKSNGAEKVDRIIAGLYFQEIYPYASGYSKEHPEYLEAAQQATADLQAGNRGYLALWNHIINVSVADIKKNYEKLNVSFELWKKESDVQEYIPDMVKMMREEGYAYESEGALVVDVKEETDTKEMPPCMILKSNGATNYETTDLATIIERKKLFGADEMIYVVDKRQGLHFEQVFRCSRKTGLVDDATKLTFVGFGTMNGKDGKPFKTRDGGVLRLETLIADINEAVYDRIMSNREMEEDEARNIASIGGLSAIKYGDLSNQASKDYVFDVDRFTSFEGNTGPYILYTIVRIKSILNKYKEAGGTVDELKFNTILNDTEKALMLELVKFQQVMISAYEELAPHKICAFIYDAANAFNRFYHECKILNCEDEAVRESRIALTAATNQVLRTALHLICMQSPDKI